MQSRVLRQSETSYSICCKRFFSYEINSFKILRLAMLAQNDGVVVLLAQDDGVALSVILSGAERNRRIY